MKKIYSAICLLLAVSFMLSSCSFGKTAVTVDSAETDNEIFTFFLDKAISSREVSPDKATAKAEAAESVKRYVTVNTVFKEMGLSLSDGKKSEVSDKVNNLWRIYGAYYEKIGVSKQTLTKVYESEAYENAIFLAYYDKDGTTPVAEKDIEAYFKENYVIIKAINGYLTDIDDDGNTVPMKEEDKKALTNTFSGYADKINGGAMIDDMYADYTEQEGATLQSSVVKKGSSLYPEGFFDTVLALKDNEAKAFTIGEYAFVIQRLPSDSDENIYYRLSREDCLKALKGEEFEKGVAERTSAHAAIVDDKTADKIYKEIQKHSRIFNVPDDEPATQSEPVINSEPQSVSEAAA